MSTESGYLAECPHCNYETVLFEDDVIVDHFEEDTLLSIFDCPECDPKEVGDPLNDRTRRLEVKGHA